ncbi:MAG: hypothetical protein ACD_46C00581G0003 [uncultured bacterium]|nr:MAG: hypothetical protein ACD_46C00581G0003 [uncultured bacterium]
MKTAIICDWLVTIGGAEKVLWHLINCFPEADLFALIDFLPPHQREIIQNKSVQTTFIQKLPFAKTKYRRYLPLMPLAIEQLNLSKYDLIISSSHAVAKGVITGPDQVHISYVHSPMRYAWDLQHQYLKETGLDKKLSGWLARYFLHKLRIWDLRSANNVDFFAANSQFIARRIQKIYRREATVIHPPIELPPFSSSNTKDDFFLTASRFVPYKKIDLIVESFQHLPDKKLIVIGDGPDAKKISKKAGKNVQLLGYQSDQVLVDYLQRAKAFIFAAEEDFGLLPVEAQACGTPVIAYGKGGVLETVQGLETNMPTGLFFQEQNIRSIVDAINLFEKKSHLFTTHNCLHNAARFAPENFYSQFKNFVNDAINQMP